MTAVSSVPGYTHKIPHTTRDTGKITCGHGGTEGLGRTRDIFDPLSE